MVFVMVFVMVVGKTVHDSDTLNEWTVSQINMMIPSSPMRQILPFSPMSRDFVKVNEKMGDFETIDMS